MSVALLFPGQGSQTPGFLHRLPQVEPVRKVLQEASELLGLNVLTLDTSSALASTVSTQLSLLVCGAAFSSFLASEGIALRATAGMSVGTYAAALACGAISLEVALRLVQRRATLMQTAFPDRTHGMAAVHGLRLEQLESALQDSALSVANRNSLTQFVVAGPRKQLGSFLHRAQQAGATKVSMLATAVPSHVASLAPSARVLMELAQELPVHAPRFTMFSNRNARPITTAGCVRKELAFNMAAPVLWHDIMSAMSGLGIGLFLESPPGHTLAALAGETVPQVRALAAAETRWDVLVRTARVTTLPRM